MDKLGSENFIRLIISLLLASILLVSGIESYKALSKRAVEQTNITESINRWKQSYKALQSVIKEWNGTYHSVAKAPDDRAIVSLINLSALGLSAETDYMVLNSVTPIAMRGIDLGLTKICLGIKGENFVVSAPTYADLLLGLDRLAARADLTISTVTIIGEATFPQANLGGFCILLRNDSLKTK